MLFSLFTVFVCYNHLVKTSLIWHHNSSFKFESPVGNRVISITIVLLLITLHLEDRRLCYDSHCSAFTVRYRGLGSYDVVAGQTRDYYEDWYL